MKFSLDTSGAYRVEIRHEPHAKSLCTCILLAAHRTVRDARAVPTLGALIDWVCYLCRKEHAAGMAATIDAVRRAFSVKSAISPKYDPAAICAMDLNTITKTSL